MMQRLQIAGSSPNDITSNLDNRNILMNVLGVKTRYQNSSTMTPNSYEQNANVSVNHQTAFTSSDSYPLVYLPKYTVAAKDYGPMTATEKEATLADSVVVPGMRAGQSSAFAKQIVSGVIRTDQTKSGQTSLHYHYKTHASLLPDGIFLMATNSYVVPSYISKLVTYVIPQLRLVSANKMLWQRISIQQPKTAATCRVALISAIIPKPLRGTGHSIIWIQSVRNTLATN